MSNYKFAKREYERKRDGGIGVSIDLYKDGKPLWMGRSGISHSPHQWREIIAALDDPESGEPLRDFVSRLEPAPDDARKVTFLGETVRRRPAPSQAPRRQRADDARSLDEAL